MLIYNFDTDLINCIKDIESFYIFKDGKKELIRVEEEKFQFCKDAIAALFNSARLLPALSVSLDCETQNAIKQGEWLQINFSKTQNNNNLLFDALLFKLETVSGFNLIRLYDGQYEGRCIYLDFDDILDLKQILNIS